MTISRWRALALALVVVALAVAPLLLDDYTAGVLDTMGIFALAAVGLGLLSGSTGQFSLGHAGFYAIGAFTAGLLSVSAGWPFWLDVPAGALLAAVAGLVLGVPALRLSGPYLAIATLGFGLLVGQVLNGAEWAGGRTGLTLARPHVGPYGPDRGFFWVIMGVLVVASLVAHNMRSGATGRAFVALRESEPAAQASGINLARYRITAFVVSAFYTGAAGALYAHWAGYISAISFGLPLSISFVAMIVVGGIDSTVGAIVGAIFLSFLAGKLQDQANLADMLNGAIIVVMVLFLPAGLMGLLRVAQTGGWRLRPPGTTPFAPPLLPMDKE
jgi:branched-chain amino acid transport system permease protein